MWQGRRLIDIPSRVEPLALPGSRLFQRSLDSTRCESKEIVLLALRVQ